MQSISCVLNTWAEIVYPESIFHWIYICFKEMAAHRSNVSDLKATDTSDLCLALSSVALGSKDKL